MSSLISLFSIATTLAYLSIVVVTLPVQTCIKTSFGHVCNTGEMKIGGTTIGRNRGVGGSMGRGSAKGGMGRGGMGKRGFGMGESKRVIKKKHQNNAIFNRGAVKKMKNACWKGQCRKQPKSAKRARKGVLESVTKQFTEIYNGDSAKAEKEAIEQVKSVYAAKKAVAESQRLEEVIDPLDDGLWEGDMILTKEQAAAIAYDALNGQELPTPGKRRKARNALFVKSFPKYKWDLPINYRIMPGFTTLEEIMIRDAINHIESRTCVRFRESGSGHHMRFNKSSSSANFCGRSPVGNKRNFNVIEINTDCSHITGVTIHEILHSLGIHHTQNRHDRDNYIKVLYENIDQQLAADFFGKLSSAIYSTYGTSYDYTSIMHYGPYAGSNKTGMQSMEPTRDPRDQHRESMGSLVGGLSKADVELVIKMYCKPDDCQDDSSPCGEWANMGYCAGSEYTKYMLKSCKKSCNIC